MFSYNENAGIGRLGKQAMHNIYPTMGKVFFVGDSSTAELDRLKALFLGDPDGELHYFDDLEECLNSGAVVANSGAVILLAEGHSETVSTATSINLDIAGVTIVGLGNGSLRPTISFTTATTATIPVSAANVTIKNVIFTASFADIVATFTLAAAANFVLEDCYINASAVDVNFLNVVDTSATTSAANGLAIRNCKWIEPDTATLSLVKLDGDNSDVEISGNFVQLGVNNNEAALMTVADGKSVFNLQMVDNIVYRLNTDTATGGILFHTNQSDNSGVVAGNFAQHADTASELLLTASSGLGVFNNYASGVAGASGYILPAVDS